MSVSEKGKHGKSTCERCGVEFDKKVFWQKYCSKPCKVIAWALKEANKTMKLVLFFMLFSAPAYAMIGEELAVRTILGEAEGESQSGRQAVGEVLRLRDSVKGFYGAKAIRFDGVNYWRGKRKIDSVTVGQALKAWRESEGSDITQGATHFENVKAFGVPYWASSMIPTVKIGSHQFYREGK